MTTLKKQLKSLSILDACLDVRRGRFRAGSGRIPAGHTDAGALVFKKCMACHQVGPSAENGIGPVLNGVVGRPAGQYPNYNYSSANKNSGLVWGERTCPLYTAQCAMFIAAYTL